MPLQKPGPPVSSLPLLLPPSAPPLCPMMLHRAAPAAARRPASSPAGRAERGLPEPCPRAADSPALLRARLRCLPPAPSSPRRGGARSRRRGAPARHARGGEEGPLPPARRTSESGRGRWVGRRRSPPRHAMAFMPRAAGGARPVMATTWARAGGSAVPPWCHRHLLRRAVERAAAPPWPPPSSFSSSAGDPRCRR